MKVVLFPFAVIAFLTTAAPGATAKNWYINPYGSGDAATIQAGIDSARLFGGDVVLSNGTFTGPGNRDISILGGAVTIRSDSGDPSLCTVDCQGTLSEQHWGIFATGDYGHVYLVVKGVSIVNAWWPGSGGIGAYPSNGGVSATIRDCAFIENTAGTPGGGGVFLQGVSPAEISNCRFTGNAASGRGGALGLAWTSAAVTNCTFFRNHCDSREGTIWVYESSPTITSCTFSRNTSPGGTIALEWWLYGTPPSVAIENTIFAFGSDVPFSEPWWGTGASVLSCCDVYGNAGGNWVGPIAGQDSVRNNFSADPLFCNNQIGALTLAAASGCLPGNNDCGLLVGACGWGCDEPTGVLGEEKAFLDLSLAQNYPNPFNPTTTIKYSIAERGQVTLKIYNAAGHLVRTLVNEEQAPQAGGFAKVWNGLNDQGQFVASGVYFYQLTAKNFEQTKKLVLLR